MKLSFSMTFDLAIKLRILNIILFLLLCTATHCFTADNYVRTDASGGNTGSDWTNAWTELPDTLTRGDTYYIADGVYPPHHFNDTESGASYIQILKATPGAHGTDVGWNDKYGDGQAVFNDSGNTVFTVLNFTRGYYILDGIVGDPSDTTSYGFKITDTAVRQGERCYYVGMPGLGFSNKQVDHIILSHIMMNGWGETDYAQSNAWTACCIYTNINEDIESVSHLSVSHCWMGGCSSNMLFRRWVESEITNNWFNDNWSSPKNHGEQISPGNNCDDIVLKNNVFKDSAVFVLGMHKQHNERWRVFNNIILGGTMTSGFASADSGTDDVFLASEFHHNTFINATLGGRGAVFVGTVSNRNAYRSFAYNNLLINCENAFFNNGDGTPDAIVYDNNAYYDCPVSAPAPNGIVGSGNPLDEDYAPKSGEAIIDTGRKLSGLYNIDYYGNSREQGNGWDIGAVEHIGSSQKQIRCSLYPNPADSYVFFDVSLEKASSLKIRIFNVLGQQIAEMTDTDAKDTFSLSWDASGHASGVYFYSCRADGLSFDGKFSLIR